MYRTKAAFIGTPSTDEVVIRRLKPGPGLSREAVAIDQKLRLGIALSSLAAECGYEAVTVRALIARAHISTSTFYRHYASVDECFAHVIRTTIGGPVQQISDSRDASGDFLTGLRSAMRYLMERLAREPQLTQAVFIEAFSGGARVRAAIDAAIVEFETLLAAALLHAPRPAVGTTHLAAGLVAGVVRIVRKTTLTDRVGELPELADELTDWMLTVAREEVAAFVSRRPGGREVALRPIRIECGSASRESIADSSRRAFMAAARLAADGGPARLTSARIRKDAGLSREEFDRHFTGVEDCFLGAVESIAITAASAAERSALDASGWERRLYKTMTSLCAIAAGEEALSRVVLLDVTAPGRLGLLRREELIRRCAAHLRAQAPPDKQPSELVADASISAIWRIAETEVAAGRTAQLPRIAPAFVYMILASCRPRTGTSEAVAAA